MEATATGLSIYRTWRREETCMISVNLPYLDHTLLDDSKHDDRDHTIWLPRSSQLERPLGQPGKRDNQFCEIYVCPGCGLVFEYRSLNVHYRRVQLPDPNAIVGRYAAVLKFQCSEGNCESPLLIRKSTMDPQTTSTLVEESKSWILGLVRCPKGHPVAGIPSDAVALTDKQLGPI